MANSSNDNFEESVAVRLATAQELHLQETERQHTRPAPTSQMLSESVEIVDNLLENNMLVPGSDIDREVVDQYRKIKRPLISNAFGKTASLVDKGNLIMVTSSVPGEGKTYTAINLALSMVREQDNTVLLVDADVTKKGSSRLLGTRLKPGITDVLEDEYVEIGDVILRTDIPQLSLLPAGKHHEDMAELLASNRMASMVEELSTRYSDRIIVFDAPPVLSTPQTQILAGLVGQIVFVVEAGSTPHAVVDDALDMLPEEKPIGLVLNKAVSVSNKGGYYYGYYTPYGDEAE